jgi:hypothetical protein
MPTVGVNRKVDAGTEFAVQMLVGAGRLLARGWCQEDAALDARGEPVEPAGLVSRGFERADLALAAVIGDLVTWNDAAGRRRAEVLAAVDRALGLVRGAR